jgi:hypothetical protein
MVKIIEPIAPEIVLLGLNFVNLGPLNNFPKTKPPISDATQPINREKIIIFNCKKFEKKKNIKQKQEIYNVKKRLTKNENILLLRIFFIKE